MNDVPAALDAPPRRTRLRRAVWGAALLLVALVSATRLLRRPAEKRAEATAEEPAGVVALGADAQRQAGIQVEPVRQESRTDRLEAPGVLALDETRTARVGSLVEGNVVATRAEVGQRVGAGTLLAALHSHVIHDAWADYRKAMAERRRRTKEVEVARHAAARAQRLFDDKALSAQERERAEAERVVAEEELDMARTEVRRAEEALEHLGVTNKEDPSGESGEQIPVRSPLAGVVLEKYVTTGTAVTPGTPLYVVSDLARLWAIAEIDETALPRVAQGAAAEVRVAAYPGTPFAARIGFVGDRVNAKTRRVTVRCELPNADGRLKPEMYATIALGAGAERRVASVPAAAVQQIDGHSVVFVQREAGRFERRNVELGAEQAGFVEVRAGLTAGERVATTGSFLLKSELLKASLAAEE